MKKYITPLASALLAILGFVLGIINLNFLCGLLAGFGILLLISTSIGNFILRQHVSRLEKKELDYLENIRDSVENNTPSNS